MDVLAEVHDERELERAEALDPDLIGINNRNLPAPSRSTLCNHRTPGGPGHRPGRDLVAESGLGGPADLRRLADCGVRRFLVGETLMRNADVTAAVRTLLNQRADAA